MALLGILNGLSISTSPPLSFTCHGARPASGRERRAARAPHFEDSTMVRPVRKAPSRTMGQHQPKLPMLLDMSNDHSTNGAVGDAQPVAGADETGFSDRKRPVRPQQDQCWRGASRPATGGSNSRRWRCCSRCCCWPAAAERRCRAVLRSRRASGRRAHAPAQRGSAGVRRAAWYPTSNENGPLHCTAARLEYLIHRVCLYACC